MATAPDVVGDAKATLDRYWEFASVLRRRGWQVGFVAQDGQECEALPDDYDALFIGGTTEWKLSEAADWCIRQAKMSGRWVHVGRVNSQKRIRHFQLIGVDSVDGTGICYNPPREMRIMGNALARVPLFTLR